MGYGTRRARSLLPWCALALGAAGACTFPDFVVPLPADSAGAGAHPNAGSAGGVNQGATSGAQTKGGASATAGETSTDGGGGAEPDPIDIGPCGQREHPTHCWNHLLDVDETDVDCGGPRCATCAADETCASDRDCSTSTCNNGKCERLFEVQYMQQNSDEQTSSFRFRAELRYLGTAPLLLSDIAVRYYFSRNSVTEPIIAGGSVIQFPQAGDISNAAVWEIGRQLRGNRVTNDAYLDLRFKPGKIVTEGESLEITANAKTGDGMSLFNQKTHYSFDLDAMLHESKKLTVHVKGQRVWGREPAVDDPPSCFHLGVNLDGPAVTVGDDAWLTSPASLLARYMNVDVELRPPTDAGRADMLRAGFFFHGDAFSYPVNNGSYALLAYAWSANGSEIGTLSVQGEDRDAFRATSVSGGGAWVALGPYRVSVGDGQLKLAAKGDLRLGGIELRLLDE